MRLRGPPSESGYNAAVVLREVGIHRVGAASGGRLLLNECLGLGHAGVLSKERAFVRAAMNVLDAATSITPKTSQAEPQRTHNLVAFNRERAWREREIMFSSSEETGHF